MTLVTLVPLKRRLSRQKQPLLSTLVHSVSPHRLGLLASLRAFPLLFYAFPLRLLPVSITNCLWGALDQQAHSHLCSCFHIQIREEDKSPPPSSPPPLFSVIPGGFIKQLVRETEKESKEARRRKEAALASPEVEVNGGAVWAGQGGAGQTGAGQVMGAFSFVSFVLS